MSKDRCRAMRSKEVAEASRMHVATACRNQLPRLGLHDWYIVDIIKYNDLATVTETLHRRMLLSSMPLYKIRWTQFNSKNNQ